VRGWANVLAAGVQCPSGTSCDPTDCAPRFQCLPAADRGPGDPCELVIGQATCGDSQTCVALPGVAGVCRFYCDPDDSRRGCPGGFACAKLGVGSLPAAENVCVPTDPEEDASLAVDAPNGDDAGDDELDALPVQPDATPDSGQHTM